MHSTTILAPCAIKSAHRCKQNAGNTACAGTRGVSWHDQNMILTLPEIEARVNQLAQKIGAPRNILPTYGYPEQTARPHVEVSAAAYYYVVAERGQEMNRYAAFDLDELLYKIFVDATFDLAIKYELAHRIESQDSSTGTL